MRWLGILAGLSVLACSSGTSPSPTKEELKTSAPSTQNILSNPSTNPASAPPSKPKESLENLLLPGAVVRIVEIPAEDPLSKDSVSLVGLLCTSEESGMLFEIDGYIKGDAFCGPKKTPIHFTHTKVSIVYRPQKNPPDPNPSAKFSGKSVSAGKSFTIHSINATDAYFKSAQKLIGVSCVVLKEMKNNGDGWFSGSAKCGPDKEYMYFSKISIEVK